MDLQVTYESEIKGQIKIKFKNQIKDLMTSKYLQEHFWEKALVCKTDVTLSKFNIEEKSNVPKLKSGYFLMSFFLSFCWQCWMLPEPHALENYHG